MKLESLKDKKIVIVGAGKEGKATLAYLQYHFPNQTIDMVDQVDGSNYLHSIRNYDVVIKSPGIKPEIISVPYTTAQNIFFANVKGITIGVTGTKGKSTTASLIHAILQQAGLSSHLVGNIGTPVLGELLEVERTQEILKQVQDDKKNVWVCELSSYMTGDLQYSPHISVILNLFPEHMDYHGSVERYYAAKRQILHQASDRDFFVYDPRIEAMRKLAQKTKAKSIPFMELLPFDRKNIQLPGEHNYDNVRAAVTIAKILKISDKDSTEAIKHFQPLRHRLQNIGTFHGITFYDDAISTTPESTILAIKTLKNIGTIFLGGQDRGYDFSELAKVVLEYRISNIVLFPDSGEAIFNEMKKRTKELPNSYKTISMHSAVEFAYKYTKPGSICLLSNASPSYTLWRKFYVKGNEFQWEVKMQGEK